MPTFFDKLWIYLMYFIQFQKSRLPLGTTTSSERHWQDMFNVFSPVSKGNNRR